MPYKYIIYFSDGTSTESDDVYETESEAEMECQAACDGWYEGAEVLSLAGRIYSNAEIVDTEIIEVEG